MLKLNNRLGLNGPIPWYSRAPVGGVNPALWLDFRNGRYAINQQPVDESALNVTVDSDGTFIDIAGLVTQATTDKLRLDNSLDRRGALIEEARPNEAANGQATGAVNGDISGAGSVPTGWGFAGGSTAGLDVEVLNAGSSEGDLGYVDLRFTGTSSGTTIPLITSANVTATAAEVWATSVFCKVITDDVDFNGVYSQVAFIGGGGTTSGTPSKSTTGTLAENRYLSDIGTAGAGVTAMRGILVIDVDNGATLDFTIRVGGSQFEEAAFQTSYIPTSSGAVTRSLDVVTDSPISDWLTSGTGTVIIEWSDAIKDIGKNAYMFTLCDGTLNNRISLFKTSGGARNVRVVASGSATVSTGVTNTNYTEGLHIDGVAYDTNDYAYVYNGNIGVTDNTVTVPTSLTQLSIGINEATDGAAINAVIHSIRYYRARLTNAQLQELTTLPF